MNSMDVSSSSLDQENMESLGPSDEENVFVENGEVSDTSNHSEITIGDAVGPLEIEKDASEKLEELKAVPPNRFKTMLSKLVVTMLVAFAAFVIIDIAQFYFLPTTYKISQTDVIVNYPFKASLSVDITGPTSIFPLGAKQSSCAFEYVNFDSQSMEFSRESLGTMKISDVNLASAVRMFSPRTTSHTIDLTLHDMVLTNYQNILKKEFFSKGKSSNSAGSIVAQCVTRAHVGMLSYPFSKSIKYDLSNSKTFVAGLMNVSSIKSHLQESISNGDFQTQNLANTIFDAAKSMSTILQPPAAQDDDVFSQLPSFLKKFLDNKKTAVHDIVKGSNKVGSMFGTVMAHLPRVAVEMVTTDEALDFTNIFASFGVSSSTIDFSQLIWDIEGSMICRGVDPKNRKLSSMDDVNDDDLTDDTNLSDACKASHVIAQTIHQLYHGSSAIIKLAINDHQVRHYVNLITIEKFVRDVVSGSRPIITDDERNAVGDDDDMASWSLPFSIIPASMDFIMDYSFRPDGGECILLTGPKQFAIEGCRMLRRQYCHYALTADRDGHRYVSLFGSSGMDGNNWVLDSGVNVTVDDVTAKYYGHLSYDDNSDFDVSQGFAMQFPPSEYDDDWYNNDDLYGDARGGEFLGFAASQIITNRFSETHNQNEFQQNFKLEFDYHDSNPMIIVNNVTISTGSYSTGSPMVIHTDTHFVNGSNYYSPIASAYIVGTLQQPKNPSMRFNMVLTMNQFKVGIAGNEIFNFGGSIAVMLPKGCSMLNSIDVRLSMGVTDPNEWNEVNAPVPTLAPTKMVTPQQKYWFLGHSCETYQLQTRVSTWDGNQNIWFYQVLPYKFCMFHNVSVLMNGMTYVIADTFTNANWDLHDAHRMEMRNSITGNWGGNIKLACGDTVRVGRWTSPYVYTSGSYFSGSVYGTFYSPMFCTGPHGFNPNTRRLLSASESESLPSEHHETNIRLLSAPTASPTVPPTKLPTLWPTALPSQRVPTFHPSNRPSPRPTIAAGSPTGASNEISFVNHVDWSCYSSKHSFVNAMFGMSFRGRTQYDIHSNAVYGSGEYNFNITEGVSDWDYTISGKYASASRLERFFFNAVDSTRSFLLGGPIHFVPHAGVPVRRPTHAPTAMRPTLRPVIIRWAKPTAMPTQVPSKPPTVSPSVVPTVVPSAKPSRRPTMMPTTLGPSAKPSRVPTVVPTAKPSQLPTVKPSRVPTQLPTFRPTSEPTWKPTSVPTFLPTPFPSLAPSAAPTAGPSLLPTPGPIAGPTFSPTFAPTIPDAPTLAPSPASTLPPVPANPTPAPSVKPIFAPTLPPATSKPTVKAPTPKPSLKPTAKPSTKPTKAPFLRRG